MNRLVFFLKELSFYNSYKVDIENFKILKEYLLEFNRVPDCAREEELKKRVEYIDSVLDILPGTEYKIIKDNYIDNTEKGETKNISNVLNRRLENILKLVEKADKKMIYNWNHYYNSKQGDEKVNVLTEEQMKEYEKKEEKKKENGLTFMQAAKTMKRIKYFDWKSFKDIKGALGHLSGYPNETIIQMMNSKNWYVEDKKKK